MGSADPRAFARGKRAIAGSLVFIQFSEEPLMYELANKLDPSRQLFFLSDIDDLRPEYNAGEEINVTSTSVSPVGLQVLMYLVLLLAHKKVILQQLVETKREHYLGTQIRFPHSMLYFQQQMNMVH